jgi:hypothetical protein
VYVCGSSSLLYGEITGRGALKILDDTHLHITRPRAGGAAVRRAAVGSSSASSAAAPALDVKSTAAPALNDVRVLDVGAGRGRLCLQVLLSFPEVCGCTLLLCSPSHCSR